MGLDSGGRSLSGVGGENKRGCRILNLTLGTFPRTLEAIPEPIAKHCGTKQKAPGLRRELFLM